MWSSLPVLVLWMIKDKLDIFDNFRVAAVCRDWRSASASYPKTLHSVGDGLPWIFHTNVGCFSSSREIMSLARESKFVINRPEFKDSTILFSKQGWALILQETGLLTTTFITDHRLFLMNILTGVNIDLPHLVITGFHGYFGSFTTTSDGVPHRLFLVKLECATTMTIKTLDCVGGDETWTSQTYTGLARKSAALVPLISIGHNVYFLDCAQRVTVFNVADESCKVLPPLPGCGFIAEHGGDLIYVERKFSERSDNNSNAYDYSSFAVYRYKDGAPTLWEKMDAEAVMGTSWFMCGGHSCIAARGEGLKVYNLWYLPPTHRGGVRLNYVVSYDLLTGAVEVVPCPFQIKNGAMWVDIG